MAIFILAIFALVIALEATGHVVFRGRLILYAGPLAVDMGTAAASVMCAPTAGPTA